MRLRPAKTYVKVVMCEVSGAESVIGRSDSETGAC